MAQYGIDTSDPLKKDLDVKYDFKTALKPYFNKIKRYTGLAGLDQKNTLSILKQNLPNNIKDFIGGTTITSYSQFYNIVQEAEENIERKKREFEKKRQLKFTPFRSNATMSRTGGSLQLHNRPKLKKASSIPPRSCKICATMGFYNRYYWMSDCKNKISQADKPKEMNCHEMNKIHLN